MSYPLTNKKNDKLQRVLIFQGGGALGAYEAGIFKALYENWIEKAEKENRQLFDIVAGTSAGAINATLLINYVIKNKTWRGSADLLCKFWDDISTSTWYFENPFLKLWQDFAFSFREQFNKIWKAFFKEFDKTDLREEWPFILSYYFWPDKYGGMATSESFRRYWSWYQFAHTPFGTPNVLLPVIYQPDFRFFNPFNFMLRYDNTPITKTIRKYWNDEADPIKTEEGQPRLLIVSIDLQDATTVTFDSYAKENNQRMSIYGNDDKVKHEIYYNDGIKMEHLLTTISSHLRYKFPELKVTTWEQGCIKSEGKPRPFIDGFYLSNTPLREVLQAHKDYWKDVKKLKEDIPSLEIVIGDLYPTIEKGIPQDPDSIQNRIQNILFHDRSKYDEKATIMVSDYIGISKILWSVIKNKGISEDKIKEKINYIIKSKDRNGCTRKFEDFMYGRFTIDKVIRIEYENGQHLNDSDDISGKAFEFSSSSVRELMMQGYNDTLNYKNELLT